MTAKIKEVDEAFLNPSKFLPSKNFVTVKSQIERSEVFKIIKSMPKGANFHAHSTAMTSLDYILNELITQPNLYACFKKGQMRFRFVNETTQLPLSIVQSCKKWESIEKLRKQNILDVKKIKNNLLNLSENFKDNLDLDTMWHNFRQMFKILKGILTYRPNFEKYFYEALQELYDDNIMYVEVRSSLSKMYELNQTEYSPLEAAGIYKRVVDRFVAEHPGFLGVKIIYSVFRRGKPSFFDNHVRIFKEVRRAYPNFIVGFDLVGQEDKGQPLVNFLDTLLDIGKETQFFFHAGETNWYGHPTDENLFDAVLLNTKRIGHGYALLKHPKLMAEVKRKNITIELNPISNQILKLVGDMRNHPASYFFAENFPIVVSNDDPSLWGVKGLSYDFYEAFVGIMSRNADLRALKQLAINSIVYSSMNDEEKKKAFEVWGQAWDKFVKDLSKRCVTK